MKKVSFRRRSARLAGVFAAIALTAGVTAAPATAAPLTTTSPTVYVALGDSYAAGTGGGGYIAPPAPLPVACLQTAAAYPVVLGAVANLGCFGATTTDVAGVATAFGPVLASTTDVTVTVGGNDIGAGAVAVACTTSATTPDCKTALFNALVVELPKLPAKIKTMVATIKSYAPNAEIVLTGYPRLFTVSPLMTAEQANAAKVMNRATDRLNTTIAYSALANRVKYVSVTDKFKDHGIGSAQPWIVGPAGICEPTNTCGFSPFDVFHPTAAGYSGGYAAALAGAGVP